MTTSPSAADRMKGEVPRETYNGARFGRALVAGTLMAGAMAAPAAGADGRHHGRGDAEARG
ncbi:hypothetical protein, partial [Streptomyces sp. rh207]|uniref:hypothetical protein n=1 Tax=Streptomyces sp. rh207 TaxID=2034269 RepID=UPI001C54C504